MKKTVLSLALLAAFGCTTLAGEVNNPPAPTQPVCDPAAQVCTSGTNSADNDAEESQALGSLATALLNLTLSLIS